MVYFCYETDITLESTRWRSYTSPNLENWYYYNWINKMKVFKYSVSCEDWDYTRINKMKVLHFKYSVSLEDWYSDITIKPIILRSNTSSILSTLKTDISTGSIRLRSYTSSILSPLKTPAFWAAPPSRMAEMCCRGANSWPLIERSVPPSLTCPRTLNPKPVSKEIENKMKCLISKKYQ